MAKMVTFLVATIQTIMWGTIFLLPDILEDRPYELWVQLGGGHLFFVLGGAIMMAPGGYLADRFGCRQVILWSILIGTIALYTFLFFPGLSQGAMLAILFIFGGTLATTSPVAIAWGTRLVPENPGMVSAFLMGMVWCVSETIGQTGGGFLTKAFSENAPAYTLACLGFMLIIGMWATLTLSEEERITAGAGERDDVLLAAVESNILE